MKRETRIVLVFIVIGCLLASGIGVGVWRSTAPVPTLATTARDSVTPGPVSSAPPAPTIDSTATAPAVSTTVTDPREGPVEARPPATGRVTVDQSDPLLPPNAHIPAPGTVRPTTAFRPSMQPDPTNAGSRPVSPDISTPSDSPRPRTPTSTVPATPTTEIEPSSSPTTTAGTTEPSSTVPSERPAETTEPTTTPESDPDDDVPPSTIEPPEPPLVPTENKPEVPGEVVPSGVESPEVGARPSGGTASQARVSPLPAPAGTPESPVAG